MRERSEDQGKSNSGQTEEHDEEREADPDFRQRVAELGYYKILGDPQGSFAEAMREFGVDLEALQSLVVRFDRRGDTFTLELSREAAVGGVRFACVVTGKLREGGLDDLKGAEDDRGPVDRYPPPKR